MRQNHYILLISPGPPMILRVPWPMPPWRNILRASTTVMRAHGLRQKDISALNGLVAADPADRDDKDRDLVARVEAGYKGAVDSVSRFWLYSWSVFKGGHFKLKRTATDVSAEAPVSCALRGCGHTETGLQSTQHPQSCTCARSTVGTRSAPPSAMNLEASETPCDTCGLPLYGAPSCVVCDREAAYTRKINALKAPKGAYKVLLASVGNPDFGQLPTRSLPGVPRRTIRVASLADASKACLAYIQHYELGGGNWSGGDVQKDGAVIARISYNGRAWDLKDKEIPLTTEAAS